MKWNNVLFIGLWINLVYFFNVLHICRRATTTFFFYCVTFKEREKNELSTRIMGLWSFVFNITNLYISKEKQMSNTQWSAIHIV